MIDTGVIVWFVITILLMGFFAGIEMAFYSANRLSIELFKKQNLSKGIILSKFFDNPTRFLGTTLIGFTLFLVIFSLQLGDVMKPLWNWLQIGIPSVHLFFEIVLSTLVVLIFCEFIPRAIFRASSNTIMNRLSGVMNFFYQLFLPISSGIIHLSYWILKYVFNIRTDESRKAFTQSDFENLFHHSNLSSETNQDLNTELFENALELSKIKIRQCLVPRKEIIGIDINTSIEDLKKKFIETKLSKLVVYESNIDHMVGYIHQLDLFKKDYTKLEDILISIPAVPESMSATDLISNFSKERKSMAWVVDEFGGTSGIITMEDVLEEIFGDIKDEYDTEEFVEKQIAENEYILSGRLELDYLNDKYNLNFPEDESETLSGFIINFHETIPEQKERIIIDDYEFDILNVSDVRIEMVKLKKLK
jgi:putative hemolysin